MVLHRSNPGADMRWLGIFLSVRGRIDRRSFWTSVAVLGLIAAALQLLGPPGRLSALLLAVPFICLLAKRLHDLGRSGWFSAFPCALAAAGALVLRLTEEGPGVPEDVTFGGVLAALAFAVVGLVFVVRIGLGKPDPDPNIYGALLSPPSEEQSREAA